MGLRFDQRRHWPWWLLAAYILALGALILIAMRGGTTREQAAEARRLATQARNDVGQLRHRVETLEAKRREVILTIKAPADERRFFSQQIGLLPTEKSEGDKDGSPGP